MDQTRQNLLRVGDIVSEIQRSLASLKRQAAKAERVRQLPRGAGGPRCSTRRRTSSSEITVLARHESLGRAAHARARAGVAHGALGARGRARGARGSTALACEERAETTRRTRRSRADNEVRTHEAEIARARDQPAAPSRSGSPPRPRSRRELGAHGRASSGARRRELEEQLAARRPGRGRARASCAHRGARAARRAALRRAHGRSGGQRSAQAGSREAHGGGRRPPRRRSRASSGGCRRCAQRRAKLEDELGRLTFEAEDLERRRT